MTIPDREPHTTSDTGDSIPALDEGNDIYVCQNGPCDAPAFLLIHGTAASTRWWDPLVPLLTASHLVMRIDLLGHGRSAKPAGGGYGIPDQARRAGVAMDRLGIERAIVVGHSGGGFLATALAEERPDVVSALAVINTGPRMDAYIGQQPAIDPSQWPHLTDEQLRESLRSAFGRAGYQIPQQLVDDLRGMPHHALAATMQASRGYLERRALPDRQTALGKPLLVIFGEDDRRWRSSSAADYRAVPGAKVELLPGVGHSPMLEDPPRTAALLLAFAGSVLTDKEGTDATVG